MTPLKYERVDVIVRIEGGIQKIYDQFIRLARVGLLV